MWGICNNALEVIENNEYDCAHTPLAAKDKTSKLKAKMGKSGFGEGLNSSGYYR